MRRVGGWMRPWAGEGWVVPRSLHSMADVRAARAEEKAGHSGRDDRVGRPASEGGPYTRQERDGQADNRKLGTWACRWVDVTVGWVGIDIATVPPLHGRRSRGASGRESRPFRSG